MTPLYFGDSARQLFGVYHEPRARPPRDTGVVLCYPLGKEYMRSHWAFRQIAAQLVRAGFHVFRFDYRGTGDSAGASGDGDVQSWQQDIVTAAEELRDTAGTRRLALVGLRLGAALAATTSPQLDIHDLVLWDPVVSGARYLQQLRTLHRQLTTSYSYFAEPRTDGSSHEMLGYLYPPQMYQTIEAVDLLQAPIRAERIHLVHTRGQHARQQLQQHLAACSSSPPRCHELDGAADWDDLGQIEHALLVGDLPKTICQALLQS